MYICGMNRITIQEYKGFTIKVKNYMEGLSDMEGGVYGRDILIDYPTSSNNFYEIWEGEKCISNTLWNDDKMWTIESAIRSAQRCIDEKLGEPLIHIGTILVAKDPCVMDSDGQSALIVGKEYPVQSFFRGEFTVSSEIDKNHFFSPNSYNKYFDIK